MRDSTERGNTIAGLAVGGCIVTGVAGLLAAVPVVFSGNVMAGGVLLIASALAFGLLSIGVMSG